ncbi:Bax inhibitor 1 [Smittium culicis]|uniref:Bax inhibitor 1 n=1 Tax=Smittium culicis TaxID=133412 RepID=A0A1R1X5G1_9FUNG|nr:Bax inhibitor 1 [Smittium culicis]OMJ30408.1 Bax inhibitor 1 [Smittium culicis]
MNSDYKYNYSSQYSAKPHGGSKQYQSSGYASKQNVFASHISVRMAFMRKVYAILTAQLVATSLIAYLMATNYRLQRLLLPFVGPSAIFALVSVAALYFFARKYPINMALLAVFTLCESLTIGALAAYRPEIALQALFLTSGMFVFLTIYTFQTKYELSNMRSILYMGLHMLSISALVGYFIPFLSINELAISLLGVSVFCGYIVYDTYIISKTFSPDDYVLASITLYIDIINVFVYIFRFLNEVKEKENRRKYKTAREDKD